jgi:hypothetical protein
MKLVATFVRLGYPLDNKLSEYQQIQRVYFYQGKYWGKSNRLNHLLYLSPSLWESNQILYEDTRNKIHISKCE